MSTSATAPQPRLAAAGLQAPLRGVVGPNAVIQLASALEARRLGGAKTVFLRANQFHLLSTPPAQMVDESVAQTLFLALYACFGFDEADMIAREAGRRTADYVIAHRIPKIARCVLPHLPRAIAAPVLLSAIARSAWTFAGSGQCKTASSPQPVITIARNPLAMPLCAWHAAVFTRLFEVLLAAPIEVDHPVCCHDGADVCRFEIQWRSREGATP